MRDVGITSDLQRRTIRLGFEPPYAWTEMLAYYRDRAVLGVEVVNGAYSRSIRVGESSGYVTVRLPEGENKLTLEIHLQDGADTSAVERRLRDLLDLDARPLEIGAHLARDPMLKPLVEAYPGLRLPGCWNIFETIARAIVGQQVSVKAARTVLGRLATKLGQRIEHTDATHTPSRVFPLPAALADTDLRPVGLNSGRANALREIARRFTDDPSFVHARMPLEEAYERLLAVRGIGPWTASYVMLRGLRDRDAFPAADLGALKAARLRDPKALEHRAERWRPWRGYALLYLWKSLAAP